MKPESMFMALYLCVASLAVERRSRWRGQGAWATLRVETFWDGAVVAVSLG